MTLTREMTLNKNYCVKLLFKKKYSFRSIMEGNLIYFFKDF